MKIDWKGVFPAVVTQFNQDQTVDLDGTARHIEVLIASGVSGIVMLGSLGENTALSSEEKRHVMEVAVRTSNKRVPVLCGVAECSTAGAARYARDMQIFGADGLMVLPAMVYKSDPRETINHFRAVARNCSLPIICYNNPLAYGVDITPEMFAEMADEKSLVAIKESSGDVRRITDIINLLGDRYVIFAGVDDLIMESVLLGAVGWIAGLGQAFPEENKYLWDLMMNKNWETAREVYRWFMPMLHLDTQVKFVQYIKLAVQECGLGAEWVRAPRLPLEGKEREEVLAVIHRGMETRPQIPATEWKS